MPPPTHRVLRRLFLTLFLRGRSARGLRQGTAPKSIGSKLAATLVVYALLGVFALAFLNQPVFSLAIYLHSMTFVFLGMFVAASAGEVLFNKEEAEILMHRPVTPGALLWAKVRVLTEVSLWLAGAVNLVGLFAGAFGQQGDWRFPLAHAFSTASEALFCASFVVLIYQICLRCFGRERLEGLMTLAQVIVAVAMVLAGQMLPQVMSWINAHGLTFGHSWWLALLPPVWFAGLDDALAGNRSAFSEVVGAIGLGITGLTCWMAFGKLARSYETGLQALQETAGATNESRGRKRWLTHLTSAPPLSWWLRDPVARASFLLTAAYLVRDRDIKLRIYPGVAPMLILPIFMVVREGTRTTDSNGFIVAFASGFISLVPLMSITLLQYSQQWQAGDLFRLAPSHGPGSLSHGVQRAVLLFLVLPALFLYCGAICLLRPATLPLLIPGLLALPVLSLIPGVLGHGVPLSRPPEEAKGAGRGLVLMGVMACSMALSGLATLAWEQNWFVAFIAVEALSMTVAYFLIDQALRRRQWPPTE